MRDAHHRDWIPTVRQQVARTAIGFAAVLGLLGQFISFYPGAELGWFGVAAAVVRSGYSPRPGICGWSP